MSSNSLGKVLSINQDKGYGFILSNAVNKNIYFRNEQGLEVNDKVVFKLEESERGLKARLVRRVFQNDYGIRIFARPNVHHIHLDIASIIPMFFEEISDYEEEFLEREFVFEQPIGFTECLKVDEHDEVIYGIRKGRLGHTRFVLNRQAQQTNSLFVILKKVELGYMIITIFKGKKAAREPFDPLATEEDLKFWQNHALVFDSEIIIEGSQTQTCPWVLNQHAICKLSQAFESNLNPS